MENKSNLNLIWELPKLGYYIRVPPFSETPISIYESL